MGLMDNLKATVKNAASKTGEVAETTTLKTRISNLEYETDKIYKELGMVYYNNEADFKEKSKDLCEKIKANLDQIENLKKEIEKSKSEGKAEREANRQAAKEAAEKDETADNKGGVEKIDLN